jgi:cytochrome c oxidase cbb3-type subunit III
MSTPAPNPHTTDDLLLDHEYDGIKEYDNPMPRWWLYLFYATIAYALLYYIKTPGTGGNQSVIAEYSADSVAAAAQVAAREKAQAKLTDAQLFAMAEADAVTDRGKETYGKMCASCHRADAGGSIGPNLVDDSWIHVATAADLPTIIGNGVTAKGMPAWKSVLSPTQVADVAAYILSVQGRPVANGKPAQGTRVRIGRQESEHDDDDRDR